MKRYICSEVVKGATHRRNGLPCQDNKKIIEISDQIAILVVADGHGSEKCTGVNADHRLPSIHFAMSRRIICIVMRNIMITMPSLLTFLNREGDTRFAQDICEEWQARVKQSFYKNQVEEMRNEAGEIQWKSVFTLYGTTLLGMLITEDFTFSFQIGDGDIVLVKDDSVSALVEPEKFLGTETHSLSKIDAWRKAVASVQRREQSGEYMYLLSTDGFANSYTSDMEFQKTCMEYRDMIKEHGAEAVQGNLKKWLTETSELGCGDDITVVMGYFTGE